MKQKQSHCNVIRIFILCMTFFAIYVLLFVTIKKEYFSLQLKNSGPIILLGDSILKNNDYVTNKYSVESFIRKKTKRHVYCFAKDDETIIDVYDQLDKIPIELNTENTDIFLSIGGNDIINNYNYLTNVLHKKNHLNKLFSKYFELVKSIQTKMNKTNLILLDIYYPTSSYYRSYIPIIEEWNKKLYEKEYDFKILRISKYLKNSKDFVYNIEPSRKGGEKIADMIINE